jgi:hypothetical protein
MVGPAPPENGLGADSSRERALLSLRASRHDEWKTVLDELGFVPLSVEEAAQTLAGQRLAPLHKLRVLHDLGALGRLQEMTGPAQELAAGVVDPDRFGELMELASRPELNFEAFVASLNTQGIASTTLMVVGEACTDDPIGPGPNQPTRIVASFEAPGNVPDFAYGADPLHWPDCNPFFLRMTPGPKTSLPAVDNVDGNAYQARITEVVGIPLLWELTTQLDVRYFVAKNAVGMEFTFAGGDGKIDVDHGYVIVEPHPSKANWVAVRSQKTVHFTTISNFPATLACELGWVYVMQNMATCGPSN